MTILTYIMRKKRTMQVLLFFFLMCSFMHYGRAQGTWTRKIDLTGPSRTAAAGFAIGDSVFIGTGFETTQSADFWGYDPVKDQWNQLAPFPGAVRYLAVGFSIGNKGYIGMGRNGGYPQDLWQYDPATNKWTAMTPNPSTTGGFRGAVAFVINGKAYIGVGGTSWTELWEYDPAVGVGGTWKAMTPHPIPWGDRYMWAAAFTIGNKGYVGTGANNNHNAFYNDFYEFDPAVGVGGTWTKKADYANGTANSWRAFAVGFAINGKGYIGSGEKGGALYSDFWEYDPATDKWSNECIPDLLPARCQAVAVASSKAAYVLTGGQYGCNGPSCQLKDFWKFTPGSCCDSTKVTATFTNTTVCKGDPTQFTDGSSTLVGNIIKWNWAFGDGKTDTLQNPSHTYTSSGTYTASLVVTTDSGCTKAFSKTVTVNALPTVSAGTDAKVCKGSSTALKPTTGLKTYSWSPSTGLDNASIEKPVATPGSTTDYILLATDLNACSNRDTVTITVDSVTVTAGADVSLCKGSDTVITATAVPSAGVQYSWTPNTAISSSTISNPRVNPSATTTYTITVTNANNCTATDSVKVSVFTPTASITAGPDLSICQNDSIQLNVNGNGTIKWTPATGLSNDTIYNPYAKPSATTTYIVSVDGGCSGSGSDTITVKVNNLPNVDAGNNDAVCMGSSTTLNPTAGLKTYSWSPATGLDNANASNPKANPVVATTYVLTATDANGCTSTDSLVIAVNDLPTVKLSVDESVLCLGSVFTLRAAGTGGVSSYSWNLLADSVAVQDTVAQVKPTQAGTYYYGVIAVNACGSDTDSVAATALDMPTVDAGEGTGICKGDSVQLNATTTGSVSSYTWLPSETLSDGSIADPIATPQTTTTYTVEVSNGTCTAADSITISVNAPDAAFTADPVSGTAPLSVNFINTSTGANDYLWSFEETATSTLYNPSYVFSDPGTYNVKLTVNSGGCMDSANITITVNEESVLWIPNAFTPGDVDNTNNVFRVESVGITELKVMIFDRWGELIYDWTDINGGWDGNYKGQPAQEGVYVYIVKATGIDNQIYQKTGHVTLLRQY